MNENRRLWLAAELLLVVVAFLGPWAYERIHVPAEFTCSPPNIRLEGDFCGTPASGMQMMTIISQTFKGLPGSLLRGEEWRLSGGFREIAIAAIPFFLVLPLFTILGRVARDQSRVWRALNFVAWGLGFAVAGFIAVVGFTSGWRPAQAWGVWLYLGLAMVVLIVEIVSYRLLYKPYLP